MVKGREPRADDEVALGRVVAERHGIHVGDQLAILGRQLRVVGLADADMFMSSFVFVTHAAQREAAEAELRPAAVARIG